MKLYVAAAYLRKHSVLPDIRSTTNVRDHPSINHSIRENNCYLFFSSFRRRSICPVGGVESPSLPSKAVPYARPVDPPRRSARFGTSLFLHSFLPVDSKSVPKPPSSKIDALPVRRLLPRWPPGLLQALLRRDAVSPPSSITTIAIAGIAAEVAYSSVPFDIT